MKKRRSFAGLMATAAAVVALTVPATSSATTATIDLTPLGPLVCGLTGGGTGSLSGGLLLALNLRVCPS
jgi:hypothetical protein